MKERKRKKKAQRIMKSEKRDEKKKVRVSVQQVWKTIVNERHFLFGGVKKRTRRKGGGMQYFKGFVFFSFGHFSYEWT